MKTKKQNKILIVCISLTLIVLLAVVGNELIKHEQKQNARLDSLDNQVNILKAQLVTNTEAADFVTACQKNRGGIIILRLATV